MNRMPPTLPGQHVVLTGQTDPAFLKKVKQKIEPLDEKFGSNQPSWISCELMALRTIISA